MHFLNILHRRLSHELGLEQLNSNAEISCSDSNAISTHGAVMIIVVHVLFLAMYHYLHRLWLTNSCMASSV